MIRNAVSGGGIRLVALGLLVPAALAGLTPAAHAAGSAAKASPTIKSAPAAPGAETIGGTTTEGAALAGVFLPNNPPANYAYGTITFTLYGPFNAAPTTGCNGNHLAPLATADTNQAMFTVNAPPTTYTSPTVTPQVAGFYVWNVSYSGDADNNAVQNFATGDHACSTDVIDLTKTTPTLTTTPTPAPTPAA
jgi:hypothetical protein